MRTIETKVYKFYELSDEAKEKAREWYRRACSSDTFWSESVIEQAEEVLDACGFDTTYKQIYWSGFWSQGDGACFTGNWYAASVRLKKWMDMGWGDNEETAEIHRINAELHLLATDYPDASASLKHMGRYSHEQSVSYDYDDWFIEGDDELIYNSPEDRERASRVSADQDKFEDLCRDLMQWIYLSLEKEYEWMNADEQVDENITANEYEFTEDGDRA